MEDSIRQYGSVHAESSHEQVISSRLPEPSCELPIFNLEGLMDRMDAPVEVAMRMVKLSLKSMTGHLAVLDEAVATGDAAAIRFRSHSIAGVAGSVGAERVHSVAASMESVAMEGSLEGMASLLLSLQKAYAGFERSVQGVKEEG